MAKKTLQERMAAMLLAQGRTEVESKTGRFRIFTMTARGGYILVGRMGNVRINYVKPTVAKSTECTTKYRDMLDAYEESC